jgi:hypothetical protein
VVCFDDFFEKVIKHAYDFQFNFQNEDIINIPNCFSKKHKYINSLSACGYDSTTIH